MSPECLHKQRKSLLKVTWQYYPRGVFNSHVVLLTLDETDDVDDCLL